jgi:excinuclease ABC subunit A
VHGGSQTEGQDRLSGVMRVLPCPQCEGSRLGLAQRHVLAGRLTLPQVSVFTVEEALAKLDGLRLRKNEKAIAADALQEVRNRLQFLVSVGLEYLTLDRSAATLSGGEEQRIRLATQLGNRLVGVLYVLDEPTIGLHPRDTEKLLATLFDLRDLGNTVVAVEHDEHVIRRADWVIDMGPGAGRYGGQVVASGKPADVARSGSLTARYLNGELGVPVPATRRTPEPFGLPRKQQPVSLADIAGGRLRDREPSGLRTSTAASCSRHGPPCTRSRERSASG